MTLFLAGATVSRRQGYEISDIFHVSQASGVCNTGSGFKRCVNLKRFDNHGSFICCSEDTPFGLPSGIYRNSTDTEDGHIWKETFFPNHHGIYVCFSGCDCCKVSIVMGLEKNTFVSFCCRFTADDSWGFSVTCCMYFGKVNSFMATFWIYPLSTWCFLSA